MTNNVILCGFKSCGKTTVGRKLATRLNYDFIDTDQLIINKINRKLSIAEIYQIFGNEKFRDFEEKAIRKINLRRNTIISTGGGAIINPTNASHLKQLGKIVYLFINKTALYARLDRKDKLPSFVKNGSQSFDDYFHTREKAYHDIADFIFDTSYYSIDKTVDFLCNNISLHRAPI